jgi:peptidoglycan/LPS O-acetylase OafA/YrhL
MAGIRRALAIQVKTRDSIYQPAAPIPLAFEGPPPVAEITADELEPVTIGAHGEEILSSGNEAGTDPGDRRFRPDVQGLRALAVTLVVLYHAGVPWLSGGYVGVDVFFVVSGFVITGLLLRERSNAGKTSLLGFYARRARRILPAATLVTVFTVLATYHWLGFIQGARAAISGRWAAVFLANLNDIRMGTNYFSQGAQTSPFLHYWSLSVEEQFYVVFPFLFVGVALLFRQRSIRAKLAIILAVIIAGSLTLSVIQTHSSPVVAYFSPFTRAWELALGGLLASSGPVLRRLNQVPATVITWLGLAGIITASITYSNSTSYPGIAVALPVLATALVIAGGSVAPRFGSEFVLGRWLGIKGGDISYSLYLWHFPILVIAAEAATSPLSAPTRAALVLLAVVLSIITNLAFENPIRHASSLSRSTARSLGLGAALIAGAVLFTSALATIPGGSASGGSDSTAQAASASLTQLQGQIAQGARLKSLPSGLVPPVQDVTAQGILSAGIPERCVASSTSTTSVTPCTLGDQHSTKTMVLLGDSQATMWAGGFNLAAQKAGWKLVVLAKDGCPPWLQHYLTPGLSPYPQCDAWHSFTSRTIAQLRPQLVIATGAAGPLGTTPAAAVTRLVTALKADGSRVGILSNTPWFNSPNVPQPPDCLAQHSSSLQICNLSYRSFLSTHRSIRSMLQDGASAVTGNV